MVMKDSNQVSDARIDQAAAPVWARRRASADNRARAAVALAGIPFEAELVAVSRPTVPFGRVLIDTAQRVCAATGLQLEAQFPGLAEAGAESVLVEQAVEWLRVRADGLAAAAISFGQEAVREEARDAVAA